MHRDLPHQGQRLTGGTAIKMDVSDLLPCEDPILPGSARHDALYAIMCRLWGLEARNSAHNPCALAVPLERAHLDSVDPRDYLVAAKTDGVRYIVMLCQDAGVNIALMIGRDMHMHEIQVWAPETFFTNGTLLDGELAWDLSAPQPTTVFHAFDIMVIEGEMIGRKPLVERLRRLMLALDLTECNKESMLQYNVNQDDKFLSFIPEEGKIVPTPNNRHNLSFVGKTMLATNAWAARTAEWSGSCATDGVIFTPLNTPVYVNTHHSLFKWKPTEAMTIDCETRDSEVYLLASGGGHTVRVSMLDGAPLRLSEEVDDAIYECAMLRVDDVIIAQPQRKRADKTAPNSVDTAIETLRVQTHNLTMADVRAWCE